MPQFEKPIKIESIDGATSIGTLWVEVGVEDFVNTCSPEEFNQLIEKIREIDAQKSIVVPPPGLKPMSDEEVKAMFEQANPQNNVKQMPPRKSVKRTSKKNKNDEQE